ncbi:R3H domain-containing nucleic acid-binding protein [Spiroplasma endosymbiont of Stenodema calcarata]|uniref:R3H domain-containing nucleic acid-binding protein n=1 Tax=Spiroplasma endosymbiont of Stenodema calcarata TaxID=3139328 RepID=UPI003CCB17B2
MLFVKEFKSQKKFKKFLNNSGKNYFYKKTVFTKRFFFEYLRVTFFEIDDIMSFCEEHLKLIIKDILLSEKYEMSFSYYNKQILITLDIKDFNFKVNIFDFVFILENLLHTYVSRKFQNNFKIIIAFNYDESMLIESLQKVINKILLSKKTMFYRLWIKANVN